jgi:SAM-dependent methyltransferase
MRSSYGVMPTGDLPELNLRCPRCHESLTRCRTCSACKLRLEDEGGIVLALAPDRLEYFTQFIKEYEHIRSSEGRGSRSRSYYLNLPHRDTTGNNSGQWKIRSKSFDYLVREIIGPHGQGRTLLDLGAGNCWLSFQLVQRGYQPVAVDLLLNSFDGLGAADHYASELGFSLQRFQAELSNLPFQDEQFDIVLFNASFHYSEDYVETLREALRCLKKGGSVVICDTPWYARERSGEQMIAERRSHFRDRFGTPSESVRSLEFLTDERLHRLETELNIRWKIHRPWYGWHWAMRPWLAKIRNRREPSQFRIYVAEKNVR